MSKSMQFKKGWKLSRFKPFEQRIIEERADVIYPCKCNMCEKDKIVLKDYEIPPEPNAIFKCESIKRIEFLTNNFSPDKDFWFFLKRLNVKNIKIPFRLYIPDSVLFHKTDVKLILSTDLKNKQIKAEKRKETLNLDEVRNFLTTKHRQRSKEAKEKPMAIQSTKEQPGPTAVSPILIMTYNDPKSEYGFPKARKLLTKTELSVFFSKSKTNEDWVNLQLIQKIIDTDEEPKIIKFSLEAVPEEERLEFFKRAENFTKIMDEKIPVASFDYISEGSEEQFIRKLRKERLDMYYKYMSYRVYHFFAHFYLLNLSIFTIEFTKGLDNHIWITDFHIYSISELKREQRRIRKIKEDIKFSFEIEEAKKIESAPQMLNRFVSYPQLTKIKSKNIVEDKLEQLSYISEQRDIPLPETFPSINDKDFYKKFIKCMKTLDVLFEEKMQFYLSKENPNYGHLDNFLNTHILRYWPKVARLMMTWRNERKLKMDRLAQIEAQKKKRLYDNVMMNSKHGYGESIVRNTYIISADPKSIQTIKKLNHRLSRGAFGSRSTPNFNYFTPSKKLSTKNTPSKKLPAVHHSTANLTSGKNWILNHGAQILNRKNVKKLEGLKLKQMKSSDVEMFKMMRANRRRKRKKAIEGWMPIVLPNDNPTESTNQVRDDRTHGLPNIIVPT